MASKQDTKKIAAWKAANVDTIRFEVRKAERLNERIAAAVSAGKAASRQAYLIAAINARLTEDGFPLEEAQENDEP